MDCRNTLWVAVGLLCGLSGCTKQFLQAQADASHEAGAFTESPGRASTPIPPPRPMWKPDTVSTERPRKPKPSTFTTIGDHQLAMSDSPQMTPQRRQEIFQMARAAYQQALAVDPKFAPAYAGLARLFTRQGEREQAEAAFRKAIELSPQDASLRAELSVCQGRFKDYEASIASLREALRLDPDNRKYQKQLGFMLVRSGRVDEGTEQLARVLAPADVHYNLAGLLTHMGRLDEGKRHLELALQANPDHEAAQEMLAQLEAPQPRQPGSGEPIRRVSAEQTSDVPANRGILVIEKRSNENVPEATPTPVRVIAGPGSGSAPGVGSGERVPNVLPLTDKNVPSVTAGTTATEPAVEMFRPNEPVATPTDPPARLVPPQNSVRRALKPLIGPDGRPAPIITSLWDEMEQAGPFELELTYP